MVLWQEREIGIRALLTSGEDWEDYQIWLMVWHYVVEFVGNSKDLYGGAPGNRCSYHDWEAMVLREIKWTSQKKGEPKKRWFTSLGMDLFVWLSDEDEIISYQLTYNKPHDEKALTWSKEKGLPI